MHQTKLTGSTATRNAVKTNVNVVNNSLIQPLAGETWAAQWADIVGIYQESKMIFFFTVIDQKDKNEDYNYN